MRTKLVHIFVLSAISALLILIYLPGLHGPYVLDDGENIFLNDAIALKELSPGNLYRVALANESGPLRRPVASLSFAFNYYFSGGFDNTFPFKLTNLLIHIGNALLVYFLSLLLLQTPALRNTSVGGNPVPVAAVTAALWAVHPIQLTSVLYVVQRMNSLSALAVLGGLLIFMYGRRRVEKSQEHGFGIMGIGIFLGLLLGLLSKENAALLPLFAVVIEYVLYQRHGLNNLVRTRLYFFYSFMVIIPVAIFMIYLAGHPEFIMRSYAVRHFTPYERLLTEARVLWFYVGLVFLPTPARLGLFHDDISISTNLFTPPTTLLAVAGWCVLLVAALLKTRQQPVITFSALWFLAGHVLESSVFGLELAYEHRNYLPSVALCFMLSVALLSLLNRLKTVPSIRLLFPLGLILVLTFSTWNRAGIWDNLYSIAETDARNHPTSARANDFAAKVNLIEAKNVNNAIAYTLRTIASSPREAGGRVDLRLLLATEETEINGLLVESRVRLEHLTRAVQIKGLPEEIRITSDGMNVHLSHTASSDDAITDLLKTEPITVHTIVALENLRHCVIETPQVCNRLRAQAFDWFIVATENTHSSNEYRAIVFRDAAMLNAYQGDYDRALHCMEKAAELDPTVPTYQLAKTEYLIRTGHLDQAKLMLNKLSATALGFSKLSSANQTALDKLAKLYSRTVENAP